METLNVGSGQTNEDVAAAEVLRKQELRGDVVFAGNLFLVAAACVLVCSGLLPVLWTSVLIDIGAVEFARHYAPPQTPINVSGHQFSLLPQPPMVCWVAVLLIMVFLVLAVAGRRGKRWAFLAGMGIYAADAVLLLLLFSIFSFGVHGFFLLKWWQAQNAARELRREPVASKQAQFGQP